MTKLLKEHGFFLLAIAAAAIVVNLSSFWISGIPNKYNLSSDATVHVVQWAEFSQNYAGEFTTDVLFQNYQGQPTGTLFVDRVLVAIADFLHIPLLDWSIIISWFSLAVFLSGVYALTFYTTRRKVLGLVVALVSIIPVISLGLSAWGFVVGGFVPKELSLGIAVWLTILYIRGVTTNSPVRIGIFYVLLGLCSNSYPVIFFHYAMILLGGEVLRTRRIKVSYIVYGLLFLAAAPVSLYDIFIKAAHFSTPSVAIIADHYTAPLHKLSYLFLHYLRKQILYGVVAAGLWYVYRRVLKREYSLAIGVWFGIWWSSLILSLIGVGIELWAPLYMKYLLSRTSVWFYAASMILVGYLTFEIYALKIKRSRLTDIVFITALSVGLLLAQSSIVNVYQGLRDARTDSARTKDYISVVTKLHDVVPLGTLVLSNPDSEAKTIRAYGNVGVYVSYKDGNVTLFDGDTAAAWMAQYQDTKAAFTTKDYAAIKAFGKAHHLPYYLYDRTDLATGLDQLNTDSVLSSGNFGLARLY